jgi:sugar-specific transcriptional regulator TrmB
MMTDKSPYDRRPYLKAIPPSGRIRERLRKLDHEIKQLQILLELASELERASSTDASDQEVTCE